MLHSIWSIKTKAYLFFSVFVRGLQIAFENATCVQYMSRKSLSVRIPVTLARDFCPSCSYLPRAVDNCRILASVCWGFFIIILVCLSFYSPVQGLAFSSDHNTCPLASKAYKSGNAFKLVVLKSTAHSPAVPRSSVSLLQCFQPSKWKMQCSWISLLWEIS